MPNPDYLNPTDVRPADVIRAIGRVLDVISHKLDPRAVLQIDGHILKIPVLYHTGTPRNEVRGRVRRIEVCQAAPQGPSDRGTQLRICFFSVFADRSEPQRIKRDDQGGGPSSKAACPNARTQIAATFMAQIVCVVPTLK